MAANHTYILMSYGIAGFDVEMHASCTMDYVCHTLPAMQDYSGSLQGCLGHKSHSRVIRNSRPRGGKRAVIVEKHSISSSRPDDSERCHALHLVVIIHSSDHLMFLFSAAAGGIDSVWYLFINRRSVLY